MSTSSPRSRTPALTITAAVAATLVSSLAGPITGAWADPGCATCRAIDSRTQVTFSPVTRANRLVFDDITILDAQGSPLDPDVFTLIPSTNDDTSALANGPVLMVDSQVGFTIGLNGKAVTANQPFTVTVVRAGETRSVNIEDLNPALTSQVAIEPAGALTIRGVPLRQVQVTQTYDTSAASYRFVGVHPAGTTDSSLSMRTYGTAKRVIFRDTNGTKSTWSLQMRSTTRTSSSHYQATGVRVPRGDQLIVVYSLWRGSIGKPSLWLDRHSDGRLDTKLTLVKG